MGLEPTRPIDPPERREVSVDLRRGPNAAPFAAVAETLRAPAERRLLPAGEVAARFGAASAGLAQVRQHLESASLSVVEETGAAGRVRAAGPAEALAEVCGVQLLTVAPREGRRFHSHPP